MPSQFFSRYTYDTCLDSDAPFIFWKIKKSFLWHQADVSNWQLSKLLDHFLWIVWTCNSVVVLFPNSGIRSVTRTPDFICIHFISHYDWFCRVPVNEANMGVCAIPPAPVQPGLCFSCPPWHTPSLAHALTVATELSTSTSSVPWRYRARKGDDDRSVPPAAAKSGVERTCNSGSVSEEIMNGDKRWWGTTTPHKVHRKPYRGRGDWIIEVYVVWC